jgi:hypothetical protein
VTVELSVILATDSYETIRHTLAHLGAQTVRDRLELVVVTPTPFELSETGFGGVRMVESDAEAIDVASLRADGVRAASAPAVLLAETHSFPAPDSLERLVERHREPWAAVGQAICNGNPRTMRSWTNLFLDYGRWADPDAGGPVRELPTHNSSFKRQELLACGDDLPELLRYSYGINEVLRSRGGRLYLEPRARTMHVNVSRTGSWFRERAAAGRAFAGVRAQGWPAWRRVVYAGGSPLLPLIRGRRVLRDIKRTGRTAELVPRILPALAVGLAVSAAGELTGYALGAGRAQRVVGEMELHRMPHVAWKDELPVPGP